MRSSTKFAVVLAFVVPALVSGPLLAEDTKGKWQFGFGLSYYATVDYIRSNADLAIAGHGVDENGLPSVGSVDERPDINIKNQASIADSFKIDGNASYGLTRWLALELSASYMNAPVGNIEFYTTDSTTPVTSQGGSGVLACGNDASTRTECFNYNGGTTQAIKGTDFLPVGTITEIPIHLAGLVRFRPESPFDPYIGLGIGYRMADLKEGDEFAKRSEQVHNLTVSVACEGEYTRQTCSAAEVDLNHNGKVDPNEDTNMNGVFDPGTGLKQGPFAPSPMTVTVKDSFEWFAAGGVDYYVNDKFSFYVDARYVWNTQAVDITIDDAHQVRLGVTDPGRLMTGCIGGNAFCNGPSANPSDWYLWEDLTDNQSPGGTRLHELCPDCRGDGLMETEDKNGNNVLDRGTVDHPENEEDTGFLYALLPGQGPSDISEAMQKPCPLCVNGKLDTEDANGNRTFDRYMVYGIDICTTQQGAGNPVCRGAVESSNGPTHYVWPENCAQDLAKLGPAAESGCPAFPVAVSGQTTPNVSTTNTDNAPDVYLIQGGKIRLGGFALGMGFKFSF